MSRGCPPHRRSAVTVALLALFAIHPTAAAEPAPLGVLVLRNGNVLQGAVRAADGCYFVERGGASLQVPAAQVEMACATLVEAYERRRAERAGTSADAHLTLARWCLSNGLLDQAAREVLDARTRDPHNPALPTLDGAIRWALEVEASRQATVTKAVEPSETASQAGALNAQNAPPPLDLSVEAQSQFVRSIQPMLVQSCAVGGCHQPDAAHPMQLDRWALEGNGNPELIRRNLDAVLAQLNVDDPPSSPVMIRSRQPHGVARYGPSKPLASHQAALLLEWLNAAAGVEQEDSNIDETAAPPASEVQQTAYSSEESPPASAAIRPTKPPAFKPRDEFDPETFNRRMAAKAPSLVESPPSDADATLDDAEIEAAIQAMEQSAAAEPTAPE